ncbi:MAG TPA: sigma-70 family RNA polymerase sigma factor [Jatrophihabitans sp.]|nr:sigma-70 family RNA polymerase sigma factor [Jatrophihabitans sp.]
MDDIEVAHDQMARAMYDQHAAVLLSYVRRLVGGDRQLAEDIVQETLLRAWRHGVDVDVPTVRPWLFTTARHLVIDVLRARRVRPQELATDDFDQVVTADGIDQALDAILIADALASLNDAHRAVLIECYYRGRTAAEVAAEQGLPPGTVRSRIHYALRALRLALQERGVSR